MQKPPLVRVLTLVTLIALGLSGAGPANADDQPFVTIYTTDIQSARGREIEQFGVWKSGYADQRFNAFRSRSEIEYGITDDLQGSVYLNYDFAQSRTHLPAGSLETENAFGVSGEVIWRLLNPYFDPIGLALYVEPAWSAKEYSFETKLLLQKNFLNATLRTALNINFEDTWVKNSLSRYDQESALEFDFGASWNATPDFSIGFELDNERAFLGEVLGGAPVEAFSSFYLGPTLQYIGHPWSVTLGAQMQLPIATGQAGEVVNGYAANAENFRTTLRFTTDF